MTQALSIIASRRHYEKAVLGLSPIHYWRTGNAGANLGSTGGDATVLTGVTSVTGLLTGDSDQAWDFPGGTTTGQDHVTTPISDAFLDGDWSITAMVQADSTANLLYALGSENSGSSKGVHLRTSSSNSLIFATYNGSASVWVTLLTPMATGTTYHVTVTYDVSSGALLGYINGALVDSDTSTGGFGAGKPINFGEVYNVGSSTGTTRSRRWNGRIDEVAIFDRVLDAGDVLNLYHLAGGVLHT